MLLVSFVVGCVPYVFWGAWAGRAHFSWVLVGLACFFTGDVTLISFHYRSVSSFSDVIFLCQCSMVLTTYYTSPCWWICISFSLHICFTVSGYLLESLLSACPCFFPCVLNMGTCTTAVASPSGPWSAMNFYCSSKWCFISMCERDGGNPFPPSPPFLLSYSLYYIWQSHSLSACL